MDSSPMSRASSFVVPVAARHQAQRRDRAGRLLVPPGVVVGFMVTATSGLPDGEQGLATGLATMSRQIGTTMGTPVMSAVVAATLPVAGLLPAITTAIAVDAALCLPAALLVVAVLSRGVPEEATATPVAA
jgi:hypothetical protein